MDDQVNGSSVHALLPPKHLVLGEQRTLIDLAFSSPEWNSVSLTWLDGSTAHTTYDAGLTSLMDAPAIGTVRVEVDYTDQSRLVYEPVRGVVTTIGADGDEARSCAQAMRDEYDALPDHTGAILAAKLILRICLIAIFAASAVLLFGLAVTLADTYRVGMVGLWAIILIGGGAWSEYLESEHLRSEYVVWGGAPERTWLLRVRSPWYSRPIVIIPAIAVVATALVAAAAVLTRVHVPL
jgi:hypothetical protein